LVTFLALDGAFFALAGAARFSAVFTTAFFGVFVFFISAALCFFIFDADAARPRAGAGAAGFSVFVAVNLKDPEAPLPFVCTNSPEAKSSDSS
jgi:hypothetical protein